MPKHDQIPEQIEVNQDPEAHIFTVNGVDFQPLADVLQQFMREGKSFKYMLYAATHLLTQQLAGHDLKAGHGPEYLTNWLKMIGFMYSANLEEMQEESVAIFIIKPEPDA